MDSAASRPRASNFGVVDAGASAGAGSRSPRCWFLRSSRLRILGFSVGLLALAVVSSVLASRELLFVRLDQKTNADIAHEVDELRALARNGFDPRTGRPFTSVTQLLDAALGANVAEPDVTALTYVNGTPYHRSSNPPPLRLDLDTNLTRMWGRITAPTSGTISTAQGAVRYAAIPVQLEGSSIHGVFVTAIFRDREAADVEAVTRIIATTGAGALLIASTLSWAVTGKILAPVRQVSDAARQLSDTDLTRRIPVRGHDEIADLAATFNEMLSRLEAAFAAQRSFVNDASHELRTPITIIRGHLELLGDDPKEQKETIALVTHELDRMTRMVNDLLELARSGQPDFLTLGPVDVAVLTAELFAKASALGPRGWQLDAIGASVITADRQRLTQAVLQLAQNALEHTVDDDEIVLGSAVGSGMARFWVSDTGPGIAPADQAHVFNRFARAGTRRRSNGFGLGLAIVREIAEAHGGRVELRSTPGKGSTFGLVFPATGPKGSPANSQQA